VVAATHRALREEAREGRFRADLLYRLRVVPIFLPALRERRLDVALLVRRFIDQFNLRGPRRITAIAPTALQALLDHSWPGNVRELKNVVEYAFAVGRSATLTLDDLPPELRAALPPTSAVAPSPNPTDEAERVRQALAAAQGDINAAAAHLGLSRTTFWRLRRRLGV
jgi:DNA-binding NtrC family response regulator